MGKIFAASDLEWEDPPMRGASASKLDETVELVKAMVPALRERVGQWAVVEVFDGGSTASYRAGRLRGRFGRLDSIEARLQFRGSKLPNKKGSKLYVRLTKVPK